MSPLDPALFKEAMRNMASSVAVIATDGPAGRAGLTVSSLSSLSMEPPSVVLCVHANSTALPALLANGVFTANVLAHDQSGVADAFAGQVPAFKADKFACAEWEALATGAPALRGALITFDCKLAATFAFGTHHIVAGEVLALAPAGTGAAEPLIYANRAYRRLQVA
ncbi:flavin reductase family protein [Azorhizobium doebereinerae]|uniref:flavin reductase family protein n=1 Tax=Azorhizobium doebereinerae TaxID=281091 RepID=UPI00041462AC|nr:flavin reductase family protein [Azorhizobium doebereinerae]